MANIYEEALEKHRSWKGKIEVTLKVPIQTRSDLNLAYTPGVAEPCRKIHANPDDVYTYTWKGNSVAVITDGTAVLGLGDIGAYASLPVMEGKCALFKNFGGVDAVPIALDTKDPNEIIAIVRALAPSFGGFNLEDISAPRCVEIERALIRELDIPVFHDDQHGTAIVVGAGIINALKLAGKKIADTTIVISGAGAAGSSIIHMMKNLGAHKIYAFNINGIIHPDDIENYDFLTQELAQIVNPDRRRGTLKDLLVGADIFIGVSAAGIVTKEMVRSMNEKAIVFAMANPDPEISYHDAKEAGAFVAGTGRSDTPNQVNNILAFPGIFRGALDVRATKINEAMKIAAVHGLANLILEEELTSEYVIPSVFDKRVASAVACSVMEAARKTGVAKL